MISQVRTAARPETISEEMAAALDHELYELGVPSDARHMRLVEFGSGTGELLARAIMTGLSCVGVEPDAELRRLTVLRIEELMGGNDGVKPSQIGLHDAASDLPASHFDFAIARRCDANSQVSMSEIARVLKPGGRWLVIVPRDRGVAALVFKEIATAQLVLSNVEEIVTDSTTYRWQRVTGIKPRYEGAT